MEATELVDLVLVFAADLDLVTPLLLSFGQLRRGSLVTVMVRTRLRRIKILTIRRPISADIFVGSVENTEV